MQFLAMKAGLGQDTAKAVFSGKVTAVNIQLGRKISNQYINFTLKKKNPTQSQHKEAKYKITEKITENRTAKQQSQQNQKLVL